MKIGILSLNPGHNYGGILQSYALQTVLERMGHEVSVISRPPKMSPSFSFRYIPRYGIRIVRRILKKSDVPIFAEYQINKIHKSLFYNRKLNLRRIQTFSEIKPNEFDAFVVGSDQVWRPRYFEKQFSTKIENAYLGFAKSWDVKRVAYAPSFGVDTWEYTPAQTQHCAELLSYFDALSVREESGVNLCNIKLNRYDVIQLCDPTMLLTKVDYENLIPSNTPTSKGNLLVYCLDESEELNKLVLCISQNKNLVPFNVKAKKSSDATFEERLMPPVESWLRAFHDAEFIVTDSFHACVFSLVFKKPFIVFGNVDRGLSRVESLLNVFGQTQRLLTKATDYDEMFSYPSLSNVDSIFSTLRAKSSQFLVKALL